MFGSCLLATAAAHFCAELDQLHYENTALIALSLLHWNINIECFNKPCAAAIQCRQVHWRAEAHCILVWQKWAKPETARNWECPFPMILRDQKKKIKLYSNKASKALTSFQHYSFLSSFSLEYFYVRSFVVVSRLDSSSNSHRKNEECFWSFRFPARLGSTWMRGVATFDRIWSSRTLFIQFGIFFLVNEISRFHTWITFFRKDSHFTSLDQSFR